MVKKAPEIARVMVDKLSYSRLLLTWDHHGSGWESRRTCGWAAERIQERLDGVTWIGRSAAVVMVPELEEWLWRCPESIARHLGVRDSDFIALVEQAAQRLAKKKLSARPPI